MRTMNTRYESSWKTPLNAKTAFRRFPRTKPDVPSQGLITAGTVRKIPVPVNPLPTNRSELRLNNNASVKLHAGRKTPAISPFPNWDISFDRPSLTCKQKRGPTHQPSSDVARRLPPQFSPERKTMQSQANYARHSLDATLDP